MLALRSVTGETPVTPSVPCIFERGCWGAEGGDLPLMMCLCITQSTEAGEGEGCISTALVETQFVCFLNRAPQKHFERVSNVQTPMACRLCSVPD